MHNWLKILSKNTHKNVNNSVTFAFSEKMILLQKCCIIPIMHYTNSPFSHCAGEEIPSKVIHEVECWKNSIFSAHKSPFILPFILFFYFLFLATVVKCRSETSNRVEIENIHLNCWKWKLGISFIFLFPPEHLSLVKHTEWERKLHIAISHFKCNWGGEKSGKETSSKLICVNVFAKEMEIFSFSLKCIPCQFFLLTFCFRNCKKNVFFFFFAHNALVLYSFLEWFYSNAYE